MGLKEEEKFYRVLQLNVSYSSTLIEDKGDKRGEFRLSSQKEIQYSHYTAMAIEQQHQQQQQ